MQLGLGGQLERYQPCPFTVMEMYFKIFFLLHGIRILIIPVIGGFIVGPIIYFFAPEAKGHGVPEVMQAILLKKWKDKTSRSLNKNYCVGYYNRNRWISWT